MNMQIINQFLTDLTLCGPQSLGHVRLYPLLGDNRSDLQLLDLDEALESGLAEITEVSDGGSVPELLVANKAAKDLIIFDGEQLIGAKQNRIANATVIVPAHSTLPIPVSCVEQGRWHYNTRRFAAGKEFAYPSLRSSKHKDVTHNLRQRRKAEANQSAIWSDISLKAERMAVHSSTSAMADIFEAIADKEVDRVPFVSKENQVGYLAFIRDGFAGGDIFSTPGFCRRKMEKLVRGYELDSLDDVLQFPRVTPGRVIELIRNARHDVLGTVGKGIERRFESHCIQGAWKEIDGTVIHLAAFPNF
jgi:hypothetical protein